MVRTTSGELVAVDVNDLSDAITREMSSLKAELTSIRSEREHELRSVSTVSLGQLASKPVYQDTYDRLTPTLSTAISTRTY
jgi:hypothetical protein